MHIDWAALGAVFGASLVVTVALVGFFTLGIVSLSKGASSTRQGAGSGVPAKAGGYLCFALCVAAVAYGIYIIVA